MAVSTDRCPICKLESQHVCASDHGERLTLKCTRCGCFTITGIVARTAEKRQLGPKLSAWLRDRTESGAEPATITSQTLDKIAGQLPTYRVGEKQLLLLRAIERRTGYPGQQVSLTIKHDFPLAWAEGPLELIYHLRALNERQLIRRADGPPDRSDSDQFLVEITAAGWEFLDQHSRAGVISDQAFVAMSFADILKPAWENAIMPALVSARFKPYRVDAEPHLDRIDTKIMTEIKNSRFVVADVTLQRPGVYFEAGYALGLGLPVFWCVRKDDLSNVHFDTRQYNHIVWESEEHLRDQLFNFISAIVGKGGAT